MRVLKSTVGIGLLSLAVGCAMATDDTTATYPGDQPVGTTGTSVPAQVEGTRPGYIPVGQELDVRLQSRLSSDTAQPEQRFQATTLVDLMQGSRVLIPAGSTVHGVVSSVDEAGRVDRKASMTLAFDRITVNGRDHEFRGLATKVFESGIRDEAVKIGTAGAVGGIIGGIIGGLEGALLGAVVGSGGVIAATEGQQVVLPAGTIVRIRLDTPLQIR